jgi:hypothetical protein
MPRWAARIAGLVLVMLPLVYLVWWNLETYMPTGSYPYTPVEEWAMAALEVAMIAGIALALAGKGRWRVLGVFLSGAPVVLAGALHVATVILPSWAFVPMADKVILFASIGVVAAGFYLQLAPRVLSPFPRK